jgi:hypothetical protein
MVLPLLKALPSALLDVVMVLPQKALLSAQPQEPLREPQPELLQAFITQSAEQPSEVLRHLLQFRPTGPFRDS